LSKLIHKYINIYINYYSRQFKKISIFWLNFKLEWDKIEIWFGILILSSEFYLNIKNFPNNFSISSHSNLILSPKNLFKPSMSQIKEINTLILILALLEFFNIFSLINIILFIYFFCLIWGFHKISICFFKMLFFIYLIF
jgi:hypothetical protein